MATKYFIYSTEYGRGVSGTSPPLDAMSNGYSSAGTNSIVDFPHSIVMKAERDGDIHVAPFPHVAAGVRRETEYRGSTQYAIVNVTDNGNLSFPLETVTFISQDVCILDAALLVGFLERFSGFTNITMQDASFMTQIRGTTIDWSYTLVSEHHKHVNSDEVESIFNTLSERVNPLLEAQTLTIEQGDLTYVYPEVSYTAFPFAYNNGSESGPKVLRALKYNIQVTFKGYPV